MGTTGATGALGTAQTPIAAPTVMMTAAHLATEPVSRPWLIATAATPTRAVRNLATYLVHEGM